MQAAAGSRYSFLHLTFGFDINNGQFNSTPQRQNLQSNELRALPDFKMPEIAEGNSSLIMFQGHG
jgi:hypothetical protein